MQKVAIDPTRCPICERTNHCAVAAGDPNGACWCREEVIPVELTRVVGAVEPDACICQRCVALYRQKPEALDELRVTFLRRSS